MVAQTSIEGTVTDASTGEAILFGSVALYKQDVLITGTETDLDGNYFLSDVDSGIYDIEASYIGYTPKKVKGFTVKAGRTNRLDLSISEGVLLNAVEIVQYKMPLIEIDNTSSNATVTAEAIRNLPTKNIAAIAATSAGTSSTDGGEISIRGSRSDGSVYYVDGVRYSTSHSAAYADNEEYAKLIENEPHSPFRQPLSTFSIDVDRASYSNIRRYIEDEKMPPVDAVRIEEMINYFNYDYPQPSKKTRPFEMYTQVTTCPWNSNSKILHIGMQGRTIPQDDLPASNLVFLIDVSGSMQTANKLPLVKESFRLLLDQLKEDDRVAIVTYAGSAGVALPSTAVSDRLTILRALDNLESGGGTAGAAGIITAYEIARANFLKKGNNRVILATDGDFNVGPSSEEELDKLIEEERESGTFLSVLGYGMGNYKDDRMQSLADKGNGNHSYIDRIEEAKKVLIEEMGGTLHTIAKDVKFQVEFNPAYVGAYRLIGYENRNLAPEDFVDDTKDAGELGSGHSVTALYEIYPVNAQYSEIESGLVYQKRSDQLMDNDDLATIKLRYKTPRGTRSWEIKETIKNITRTGDDIDPRTKHAAAVAEFGLLLRKSKYSGTGSYQSVIDILQGMDKDAFRTEELLRLVEVVARINISQ